MAEKKIAKKTTAKAPKESKLTLAEQLKAKREDLLNAKKGLYDGTLQNPHAIKAIKKEIARLMTKINQEKKGA